MPGVAKGMSFPNKNILLCSPDFSYIEIVSMAGGPVISELGHHHHGGPNHWP
jgi:hypothetical protein